MQKDSTSKAARSSKKTAPKKSRKQPDQLAALLQTVGVKVTPADRKTARQLDALYHSATTPEIVKSSIFQLFWDIHMYYEIKLPKNFDTKWLPFWEVFCAVNRKQRHAVTSLRYTWQPTPEEETELDAEEDEEASARVIFNFCHSPEISGDSADRIRDAVVAILDEAEPFSNFEVFKVAWPLALAKLKEEAEGSGEK